MRNAFLLFILAITVSSCSSKQVEPQVITNTVYVHDTISPIITYIKVYASPFKKIHFVDSDGTSSVYELSDGGVLQTFPDSIIITYDDKNLRFINRNEN